MDTRRLLVETCLNSVEWLPEIDSTNNRALLLSHDPQIELPLLIGADRQTAGRGRGANTWWGADGSLMFSILADMRQLGLNTSDWPRFSLVTGLAIAETLAAFLPSTSIGLKWPNDIWLGSRKVCGILIEQSDRSPDRLVIGIGLNVNNSFAAAPAEQQQVATSMFDEAGQTPFAREGVLVQLLKIWHSLVQNLADDRLDLVERWSRKCVLTGHPVTLTQGNTVTTGVCQGIDQDGSLLLRTAFTVERHYAGTVRLV